MRWLVRRSSFGQKHAKNKSLHGVDASARGFKSLKVPTKSGLAVGANCVSLHETTEQNHRDHGSQPDSMVKQVPHAYPIRRAQGPAVS